MGGRCSPCWRRAAGWGPGRPGGLGVVASFCCLGGMLSAGGGCGVAVAARVGAAWRGFRELLPVLASRRLSCGVCGCVCGSCVRGAVLRALGAWPFVGTGLPRLQPLVGPWSDRSAVSGRGCGQGGVGRAACSVVVGLWSDRSAVSGQGCGQGGVGRAAGKAPAWGPRPCFGRGGGFTGLGMWRVRVVQSGQSVVCRLTAGGRQGARAGMEETDRERLP